MLFAILMFVVRVGMVIVYTHIVLLLVELAIIGLDKLHFFSLQLTRKLRAYMG